MTLTASTYHPLLKRQLDLATMETEGETSDNIERFWTLFNEALRSATESRDETFNPIGWFTDMAGANMNGLSRVFSEDSTCIKSCEFHYKENRNRMVQKLLKITNNEHGGNIQTSKGCYLPVHQ